VHVLILAEGVTSRDGQRDRTQRTPELSALATAPKPPTASSVANLSPRKIFQITG